MSTDDSRWFQRCDPSLWSSKSSGNGTRTKLPPQDSRTTRRLSELKQDSRSAKAKLSSVPTCKLTICRHTDLLLSFGSRVRCCNISFPRMGVVATVSGERRHSFCGHGFDHSPSRNDPTCSRYRCNFSNVTLSSCGLSRVRRLKPESRHYVTGIYWSPTPPPPRRKN